MDFDTDDREMILAAIGDSAPNPIANALAMRITEFTNNLARRAARNGQWPTELLLYKPDCAFDDIVIQLSLQAIAAELGQQIDVYWLPQP